MKKLILLAISVIVFGFIIGTNIRTIIDNNEKLIVIENVNAFAEYQSSCSWSGWFGRGCEVNACDGSSECSRRGCMCRERIL